MSDSPQIRYMSKSTMVRKLAGRIEYNLENEVMTLSEGMCFGEWALLYNIPRTASAYIVEDTDLFWVGKSAFNSIFSKSISKIDSEKRNFLIECIPFLSNTGSIHELLKNILPIFCTHKQVIYTECDSPDYLYVIYQGGCKLTKLNLNSSPKNREDVIKNNDKLINILNLERGSIAGLEMVTEAKNYFYNLVITKDNTVLYRLSKKFLRNCNSRYAEYLNTYWDCQKAMFLKFQMNYKLISNSIIRDDNQIIVRPTKENELSKVKNTIEFKKLHISTNFFKNHRKEIKTKILGEDGSKQFLNYWNKQIKNNSILLNDETKLKENPETQKEDDPSKEYKSEYNCNTTNLYVKLVKFNSNFKNFSKLNQTFESYKETINNAPPKLSGFKNTMNKHQRNKLMKFEKHSGLNMNMNLTLSNFVNKTELTTSTDEVWLTQGVALKKTEECTYECNSNELDSMKENPDMTREIKDNFNSFIHNEQKIGIYENKTSNLLTTEENRKVVKNINQSSKIINSWGKKTKTKAKLDPKLDKYNQKEDIKLIPSENNTNKIKDSKKLQETLSNGLNHFQYNSGTFKLPLISLVKSKIN